MNDLLVVGPGAVGGGLAVLAAAAGHRVACIGSGGPVHTLTLAYRDDVPRTRDFAPPGPARVALLAVKRNQVEAALAAAAHELTTSESVVLVSNGIDATLAALPATRAVVWAFAEREEGLLRWRAPARLAVADAGVAGALARLWDASVVQIEATTPARLAVLEHEKLMVNASLNPLCALYHLNPYELVQVPEHRSRALVVANEIEALARLKGLDTRPAEEVILAAAKSMHDFPPSMLQDCRRGAATELDALVRHPARCLQRRGVAAVALSALAGDLERAGVRG
jgi:ketopantoate reductase